jgi:HEAT repeat protein
MKARTWRIRADALRDLARIAGADAIPTLQGFLVNTRQPSLVRAAAADGLGIVRAEEAVGDLLALLEAEQENLRLHTILALGEIGSAEAVPLLLEHLEDLEDRHETALTGRALALCGDPQGTAMMENGLRSSDPQYRSMARQTLMQLGRGMALRAYRRVLPRAGPAAQVELIVAIADAGDRGSLQVLRNLLEAGDTYVAEVAAAAMAKLGDRSGYQILRDGLRDSGWRYGDPVHHLLSEVDDQAIGYLVQEPFRRGDPAEKFWAATILSRFDLAAADRYLERITRQSDSPFRHLAAKTLARKGNWTALPVLAERLDVDCGSDSESDLVLLATAPPEDTMPLLELYARRGTPLERVNAAVVLLEMVESRGPVGDRFSGPR